MGPSRSIAVLLSLVAPHSPWYAELNIDQDRKCYSTLLICSVAQMFSYATWREAIGGFHEEP